MSRLYFNEAHIYEELTVLAVAGACPLRLQLSTASPPIAAACLSVQPG